MSLITLKEALSHAEKYSYAVGAFNISNVSFMCGVLQAAEETRSPVILQFGEGHFPFMDFEIIMEAAKKAAARATVPVVLHLDHGLTFDAVMKAVRYGATSVMIDSSSEPFEKNVAAVKEVVKMCRPLGISVEAEIGHVGGGEGDGSINDVDAKGFTDIDEAAEYVKQTNVDALAISCGNVHGRYKGEPKLDFDRIDSIAKKTKTPLVLHGGSGISDADFKKAISLGIRKVNFYTGNSMAAHKALLEYLKTNPYDKGEDFARIWKLAEQAIKPSTIHNMKVFGSVGMADKY